ncbi:unnamed protein product [Caenorhabditis nigoni]
MEKLLVTRLENIVTRMENVLFKCDGSKTDKTDSPSAPSLEISVPKSIELLDEAIEDKIEQLCALSTKIGGDVNLLKNLLKDALTEHRNFVWTACGLSRPEDVGITKLVESLSKKMCSTTEFKDNHRTSPFYGHICAVEAAVGGLGWVVQPKTPAPYFNEAVETSLFYINRILMAHKTSKNEHFEWAKTLKELMTELHAYIRKHHTTGLTWNSQPGTRPAKETSMVSSGGSSSIPPPPPPPPPSLSTNSAGTKDSGVAALLDSLNTGLSATSRLKKVTPDMQTHKNPSLRGDKITLTNGKTGKSVSQSEPVKNSPKILWDGKVWKIEHQVENRDVVVEVKDKKEAIYIYKCTDSVIMIRGKANTITLDGCSKTSVVFDGLLGQCEVINSKSIQVQTLGELPIISIQKTDGCHVYLSRAAIDTQIVSSKSSEMNVSAQLDDDSEEYTEMALPEQFVTRIENKKLMTSPTELA